MSALKDFQNAYGGDWHRIVGTPAFSAALALAHKELLDRITFLTDEQIETHGEIILADLRGNLKHESVLLGLHERKEFAFQQLPPEEYGDPISEAHEEAMREEHGAADEDSQPAAIEPVDIHSQLFGTHRYKGPKIKMAKGKSATKPQRKKKR